MAERFSGNALVLKVINCVSVYVRMIHLVIKLPSPRPTQPDYFSTHSVSEKRLGEQHALWYTIICDSDV